VKQLVDEYLERVLPAVLERNRNDALREWSEQSHRYRHASATMREKFDETVAALDSARIAELFRNRALARAGLTGRELPSCVITFMRTLRIPDDGRDYPLPPGLGSFPLRHVDDFSENATPLMLERGGVMMPMYQAEALWLNFRGHYPTALKIATGKIDAVSGESWRPGIHRAPQDYLTIPKQPWLDGFCVSKGVIRQFVAMPLGSGYSAEEQLTGAANVGGIQNSGLSAESRRVFREGTAGAIAGFACGCVRRACARVFAGGSFFFTRSSRSAGDMFDGARRRWTNGSGNLSRPS
jgi:hypothetical protein